ncbi:hypothetical protein Psed_6829 (plasmid) [Pseudonocardia dioxanivorans CB1190]|uniref:Uncharacterized protein n=1 Tax=Pseudonocardia dioxanivorans (strain ATCC 55486 / DSM 44775 / JCM 13855 / CB1190) TaxID=675635 RepID=F2L6K6_PSEUX|nr:hypothetical protein [Pseudonocardia dioxanivorans]AEA28900.1 hypothetical protein Psed_6829 [Pseudonocardia dioxanivorans CB1190]
MSVTFSPAPPAGGPVALGASLECPAYPPGDRRYFADYDAARAGLADHHRYCTHPDCGEHAYRPFVVMHYNTDTEPSLNVGIGNAMLLLRALGMVAELGADDVQEPPPGAPPPPEQDTPLVGELAAEQMLGRVELALALAPADAGVPTRDLNAAGTVVDFGRRPGYLQDRLAVLREVALFARDQGRDVIWH